MISINKNFYLIILILIFNLFLFQFLIGCMSPPVISYYVKNDTEKSLIINYSTEGYKNQKVLLAPGEEEAISRDRIVNSTREFTLEHLRQLFSEFNVYNKEGEKIFDIDSFRESDIELRSINLHDKFIFHVRG